MMSLNTAQACIMLMLASRKNEKARKALEISYSYLPAKYQEVLSAGIENIGSALIFSPVSDDFTNFVKYFQEITGKNFHELSPEELDLYVDAAINEIRNYISKYISSQMISSNGNINLLINKLIELGGKFQNINTAQSYEEYSIEELLEIVKKRQKYLKTGFKIDDLYEADRGIILVGAPPGGGKTTFLMQIAINYLKQQETVVYIDAELSYLSFLRRFLTNLTATYKTDNISALKLHLGKDLSTVRISKRFDCSSVQIKNLYYYSLSQNADLLIKIIENHAQEGCKVFFIDYLDNFSYSLGYDDLFNLLKKIEDLTLTYGLMIFNATQVTETAWTEMQAKYARSKEEKASLIMFWNRNIAEDGTVNIVENIKIWVKKNRHGISNFHFDVKFDFKNHTVVPSYSESASYDFPSLKTQKEEEIF